MTDIRVDQAKQNATRAIKTLMAKLASSGAVVKKSSILLEITDQYPVSYKHVKDTIKYVMDNDENWNEENGEIWFTKSE